MTGPDSFDRGRLLRWGAAILGLLLLAFVLYGSLFPFSWRTGWKGHALIHLIKSTKHIRLDARDLLVNLALYAPSAFFGALALRGGKRPVLAMTLAAGAISFAVELAQCYIPGRFSSLLDLTLNTGGAALGAQLALMLPAQRLAPWRPVRLLAQPAAALLLLAWVGALLYPYAPSLDPRKYWDSLYYLFQLSPLPPTSLAKAAVDWLLVAMVAASLAGRRHAAIAVPALFAALFVGQMVTVRHVVWPAQALGAAAALLAWWALPWRRRDLRLALFALGVTAVAAITLAAPSGDAAGPLAPFADLADRSRGQIGVAILEKGFRCGALLWLAAAAGLRLPVAAAALAAALLAAEALRAALGLGAHLTDPLLLAVLALAAAVLARLPRPAAAAPGTA